MRKILVILFLLFLPFFSNSQVSTVTHKSWQLENPGEWGSFYWSISRTTYPDANGWYYYYMYFYSNSYFYNGGDYQKAISYITDIKAYMYESNGSTTPITVDIPYTTCEFEIKANVYVAWFYSKYPTNAFGLKYSNVTPYYISKYN